MVDSPFSTRKKLPSIHSAWPVAVNLLGGVPGGPGTNVPSVVQSPAMKSSFFSSGAGVGDPICAYAELARISVKRTKRIAADERFITLLPNCGDSPERKW